MIVPGFTNISLYAALTEGKMGHSGPNLRVVQPPVVDRGTPATQSLLRTLTGFSQDACPLAHASWHRHIQREARENTRSPFPWSLWLAHLVDPCASEHILCEHDGLQIARVPHASPCAVGVDDDRGARRLLLRDHACIGVDPGQGVAARIDQITIVGNVHVEAWRSQRPWRERTVGWSESSL